MTNFCTLFDSAYLSRGLVLYESLRKYTSDFHIFIFAFDELACSILQKMNLEDATIISLQEFENERLLGIKASRSTAEYCWTCTSSTIEFVLSNYNVNSCTYLDADLCFYGSPDILLNELVDKNVLITEHRFSRYAQIFEQKRAGRFCVQFITFTDSEDSRAILGKWIDQCIEWCYSRYEDGKFGDQKYLDEWPLIYQNVHILEHHGGGIAPWNARQYDFNVTDGKLFGIGPDNNKFEVIFFHFHYVRISRSGYADLGWNRLGKKVIDLYYRPYINSIIEKETFLEKNYSEYRKKYPYSSGIGMKEGLKQIYKRLSRYNLIKISK